MSAQQNLEEEGKLQFAAHEASVTASLAEVKATWESKVQLQKQKNNDLSRRLDAAVEDSRQLAQDYHTFFAATTDKIDVLNQDQEDHQEAELRLNQEIDELQATQAAASTTWERKFQVVLTSLQVEKEKNEEAFRLLLKLINGVQRLQDFQVKLVRNSVEQQLILFINRRRGSET